MGTEPKAKCWTCKKHVTPDFVDEWGFCPSCKRIVASQGGGKSSAKAKRVGGRLVIEGS